MQRRLSYLAGAILCFLAAISTGAQTSKRVLFIGNSYIYTNDLPSVVEEIATNMGDTLIYDQSTPGGYTLAQHTTNSTTSSKIESGDWNYVVLQEQSQIPSFPLAQVEVDCFPYAAELCDMIALQNPCAETMFFMTWGRKNGDSQNCANWPPVCTYEGMDDLLSERYLMMAEQNDAVVSPVGAVWRYLRENNSDIELYSADESHPSQAGTYAAAVCFYTAIFRKDPESIMYNAGLSESDAYSIRSAVKEIVFNQFESWSIGTFDPVASLQWQEISPLNYAFTGNSQNGNTIAISFENDQWQEWDGSVLNHNFPEAGLYTVGVIASECGIADTNYVELAVGPVDIAELENFVQIYPNPASEKLQIGVSIGFGEWSEVQIIDTEGRIIRFCQLQHGRNAEIDVSDLHPGFYNVKLITGRGLVNHKLLVVE